MDKEEVTCCGLQSYYVQIRPKVDNPLPLSSISQFFSAMSLDSFRVYDFPSEPNKPEAIRLMVVGLSLPEMISKIEDAISDRGYIYSVMIGPEMVVFDHIR